MSRKAILFDLDGTLIDSLPLIEANCRCTFEALGIPWGRGEVMQWTGIPLKKIAEHFAPPGRSEEYLALYQSFFQRDHDRYLRIYPGSRELLQELKKQQYQIALVTSKGRPAVEKNLAFLNLKPYLDLIITAHDVEKHKPDPEPIFKALAGLQVQPEEALLIGDSPFDLEAGQKAGVETLGVSWGAAGREALQVWSPLAVLDKWEDIYQYL